MNIFYAWQSDTPNKTNRAFIRKALDLAVDQLGEEFELQDAERPTIDQDTQGLRGSPPIAETIFKKIRNAAVVVADVTITGATEDSKPLINSNVAIELGLALGHHGDEVLLKVMNTYYGPPESLPFDLQHRRWPVQYCMRPDQPKSDSEEVLQRLARELKGILAQYLQVVRGDSTNFVPTQSTINPASFWLKGEPLIQTTKHAFSDDVQAFGYAPDQPLIYLRIWPAHHIQPLPRKVINDYNLSVVRPFASEPVGHSWERNRYGMNTFAIGRDSLLCSTQVLKSGEIWGHDAHLLRHRDEYEFNLIPTGAVERDCIATLHEYIKAARQRFGYSERIWIEAGMVNIEGYCLALPEIFFEKFGGRIYEDIVVRDVVNTDDLAAIDGFLLNFFEAMYEAAGMSRPERLNGFPPKRN